MRFRTSGSTSTSAIGSLSLRPCIQSKKFTNTGNRASGILDAYQLANARLTWRNANDDLEIAAEVTNLFDKYYFLTIFDTGAGGNVTGQPGRPREWAVSVKKKF